MCVAICRLPFAKFPLPFAICCLQFAVCLPSPRRYAGYKVVIIKAINCDRLEPPQSQSQFESKLALMSAAPSQVQGPAANGDLDLANLATRMESMSK